MELEKIVFGIVVTLGWLALLISGVYVLLRTHDAISFVKRKYDDMNILGQEPPIDVHGEKMVLMYRIIAVFAILIALSPIIVILWMTFVVGVKIIL